MEKQPSLTQVILMYICEFIEDCEFEHLSVKLLHLLGDVGPTSAHPGWLVRYVYNRTIVEPSMTRAAAVASLAKFGHKCPDLTSSIIAMLERTARADSHDVVRDAAVAAVAQLKASVGHPAKLFCKPGELIAALRAYQQRPQGKLAFASLSSSSATSYSYDDVKAGVAARAEQAAAAGSGADTGPAEGGSSAAASAASEHAGSKVQEMPEFAAFGQLIKSSASQPLTESELEYVVAVKKHAFEDGHLVLEFSFENTVPGQPVLNVRPVLADLEGWQLELSIPAARVNGESRESVFAVLRPEEPVVIQEGGNASVEFTFSVPDMDGEDVVDEGDPEEYEVEAVAWTLADFIALTPVAAFQPAWESLGDGVEQAETYALNSESLAEAAESVCASLGLRQVSADTGADMMKIEMCGTLFSGEAVMAKAMIRNNEAAGGFVLRLVMRCVAEDVRECLADLIS
jgi:coatomer protein complex subunit gamma